MLSSSAGVTREGKSAEGPGKEVDITKNMKNRKH